MKLVVRRRSFLAGLGALAIAPFPASARLSAPLGEYTLERVLIRSLSGGARIAVTRAWAISFEASPGTGLRVVGKQSHVQVDAPPALQALTRVEASRDESALFPLLLDAAGRIVDTSPGNSLAPLPDKVVDAALAYAKAHSDEPSAQPVSRQFLSDLSEHGEKWLSRMPDDLFFPDPRDRNVSRELTLPDGTTGMIEIRESATANVVSGLLKSFVRQATTRTQTMTREGSETWTLKLVVS